MAAFLTGARFFATVDDLRAFVERRRRRDAESAGGSSEGGADTIVQELGDDIGPVPSITLEDDGLWHLRAGETVTAHETRADAFAAVEASEWFVEATGRKSVEADAYAKFAAGRWLDSTSEEDLPSAIDDSQIRAEMIGQMARNLARAKTPIPIDGGGVSEPHESLWNGAALAAGWVFAAVDIVGADARHHLWIYARLRSDVDAAVDLGSLLFGSVLFISEDTDRYGDGDAIGARLVSYALTNFPFVDGLEPHAPRERIQPMPAGRALAITRSRRLDIMGKPKTGTTMTTAERVRALADKLGVTQDTPRGWDAAFATARSIVREAATSGSKTARGPAMDKLTELAGFLGVTEEQMGDPWGPIYDAIHALQDMAMAEGVIEGMGIGEASAPAEAAGEGAAEEGRQGEPNATPIVRALLEGFADQEAQDAWTEQVFAALGAIFAESIGDPAALLDGLVASTDAFKGALSTSGTESEGDGSEPAPAAQGDGRSMRSVSEREWIETQAELRTLRLFRGEAEAREVDREIRDHITKAFGDAKRVPPKDEDHEALVVDCTKMRGAGGDWHRIVNHALRASIGEPPTGVLTRAGGVRQSIEGMTVEEAIMLCADEIREKSPDLRKADVRAQSYRLAKARFPEAFRSSAPAVGSGQPD